jgi:hypothetical protein
MTEPKRAPMEPPRIRPVVPKAKTKREQLDQAEADHEAWRQQMIRDLWGNQ